MTVGKDECIPSTFFIVPPLGPIPVDVEGVGETDVCSPWLAALIFTFPTIFVLRPPKLLLIDLGLTVVLVFGGGGNPTKIGAVGLVWTVSD